MDLPYDGHKCAPHVAAYLITQNMQADTCLDNKYCPDNAQYAVIRRQEKQYANSKLQYQLNATVNGKLAMTFRHCHECTRYVAQCYLHDRSQHDDLADPHDVWIHDLEEYEQRLWNQCVAYDPKTKSYEAVHPHSVQQQSAKCLVLPLCMHGCRRLVHVLLKRARCLPNQIWQTSSQMEVGHRCQSRKNTEKQISPFIQQKVYDHDDIHDQAEIQHRATCVEIYSQT